MEKDNFQPIVMPCTKEQYESLIPVLKKNNFNTPHKQFRICAYITNNFNYLGDIGTIDNIPVHRKINHKIYKRFNRKIFLKSLGIVEEPEFVLPTKWCVQINNKNHNIISEYRYKTHSYPLTLSIEGFMHSDGIITKSNPSLNNILSSTEITFEQFQKYVLKQDASILESQSVTNKQPKMKSTVNEIKQSEPTIKKGLLVVTQERVGIVTKYISDNNFDVTILHPSAHHGLIVTSLNYANIRIFKGKLTLEQ